MKKICILTSLAAFALGCSAQITGADLAGKYHLQASYNFWEAQFETKVYAHDDFVFSLEEQQDGSFRLYSFFYNGMDGQWQRLGYSATAQYSPMEQLLYVYQTPWLWDEYMGQFMESYGYGQNGGPMIYFLVERDPKTGALTFASTENSLGFYFNMYYQGQNQFVYAIDYPGVIRAKKLDTYASVTPATLPGHYTMSYKDEEGRQQTTSFTISAVADGFELSGIFGDKTARPVFFEQDGKGIYLNLGREEKNGYYVSYFGSNVGDCRVSFSFDADARLVADNYFSYSPDFVHWTDAFGAVAVKEGTEGIDLTTSGPDNRKTYIYDLQGRAYPEAHGGKGFVTNTAGLRIEGGKVRMSK